MRPLVIYNQKMSDKNSEENENKTPWIESTKPIITNNNINLKNIAIPIPHLLTKTRFSGGAFLDSKDIYNKLSNPNTTCNRIKKNNVIILSKVNNLCLFIYFQ